jgi:hypothetical protein
MVVIAYLIAGIASRSAEGKRRIEEEKRDKKKKIQ